MRSWNLFSILFISVPLVLPTVVCIAYYIIRSKYRISFQNRLGILTMIVVVTIFATLHFKWSWGDRDSGGVLIALVFPVFAIFYSPLAYFSGYLIGIILDLFIKKQKQELNTEKFFSDSKFILGLLVLLVFPFILFGLKHVIN